MLQHTDIATEGGAEDKVATMQQMKPLGTGLAFALTVGLVYPVCALVVYLWPDAVRAFTSALLHGIDLSAMRSAADAPGYGQIFLGFCGSVVIAFAVGLIYAWMNNLVQALFFRA